MTVNLRIFATGLDDETVKQIYEIAYSGVVDGDVAIMPDAHAGAGCVIGTVCVFTGMTDPENGVVVPNVVGVDIGCGVFGVQIPDIEIDFEALDQHLKNRVPLGMRHRVVAPRMTKEEKAAVDEAVAIQEKLGLTRHSATVQVGTLGGGNHFIEIAQGKSCKWVLIHSGSRNFGLTIAKYYQAMAKGDKRGLAGLKMKEGGADYLHDMRVAQRFAKANRSVIMRTILDFLGVEALYSIDCVHNFIGDDGICRKGAISAYKGEPVLIPLNMRDGTVIGFGKGNHEFLNSAPHGAGRAFGRGQMKRRLASGELTVEGFKKEMEGIYTTTADASTIDESPMAYKPFEQIKEYLEQTVTISEVVKPIYNLKGNE